MIISKQEFLVRAQLQRETLEAWIEEEWLIPGESAGEVTFSDADVARAQLIRDLKNPAGIVRFPTLPASSESSELRIGLLRQHNLQTHQLVTVTALPTRNTLAPEPQDCTGVGSFRHRHRHCAGRCGHGDAGAEDGLRQRDRQVEIDVVSLSQEERVRLDCDLNQRVAWLALTDARAALPTQPEDLAVLDSSRNCHIKRPSLRQCQPLGRTRDSFEEFDWQVVTHVRSAGSHMSRAP